jgi:hypothetical protein
MIEVVTTVPGREDRFEGLQIKGICEEVIKFWRVNAPVSGGDGIKTGEQEINQENAEEGPDGGIAQKSADVRWDYARLWPSFKADSFCGAITSLLSRNLNWSLQGKTHTFCPWDRACDPTDSGHPP